MTANDRAGPNLEELRARYSPQPVPPCRVCGGLLMCEDMANGWSKWYCRSVQGKFDDTSQKHWWQSEMIIVGRSDTRVIELINLVASLRAALDAAEAEATQLRTQLADLTADYAGLEALDQDADEGARQLYAERDGLKKEVERLQTIITYIDRVTPRADSTCDEPGIKISTAIKRQLRNEGHPLFRKPPA